MPIDLSGLYDCLNQMGAEPRKVDLTQNSIVSVTKAQLASPQGKEVSIDEIEVTPQGVLSHNSLHVVLYIENHKWTFHKAMEDGEKGRRVHFSYCSTLDKMNNDGEFEKYVICDNTYDDFYITGYDSNNSKRSLEGRADLKVCKNCLSEANYQEYKTHKDKGNFQETKRIFNQFSFDELFQTFKPYFPHKPGRRVGEESHAGFAPDWDKISHRYRVSRGWRCEKCQVFLGKHPYRWLLHTHHISGVTSNNRPSNLQALCKKCHCDEHPHMHIGKHELELIKSLRKQQGIN